MRWTMSFMVNEHYYVVKYRRKKQKNESVTSEIDTSLAREHVDSRNHGASSPTSLRTPQLFVSLIRCVSFKDNIYL
jgi:hypothetical protein